MTIGEQIQNLRIQKWLTQERLAEMIESCIPFYLGEKFRTAEEAREYLTKLYPNLKRWRK